MTHRSGRIARIGAAAVLLAGVVIQAQRPAVPPPVEAQKFAPAAVDMRAAEWQVAALAHVSGQFDEPAVTVARWPPDLTRVIVDRAIRRARGKSSLTLDDSAPGTDRDHRTVLAKGLMLHTDIAIAERTGEAVATTGAHAWTMLDARPLGSMRISIHWGLARVLAEPLAKDPTGAPIARAWYRAVGGLYQQWADLGQLRAHLAAGVELFRRIPCCCSTRVRCTRPMLTRGSSRTSQGSATRKASCGTGSCGPSQSRTPTRNWASRSARCGGPSPIDPSLVEARIRLAHVQCVRGKSAAAGALARAALASPLPMFLEYYAAMVLGRTEAQVGHYAEAREAFERAAARYPHSQATQVALSHIGLVEGRTADGVEALVLVLRPDGPETVEDPWSAYFRLHEPDAQRYFDDLRQSVK